MIITSLGTHLNITNYLLMVNCMYNFKSGKFTCDMVRQDVGSFQNLLINSKFRNKYYDARNIISIPEGLNTGADVISGQYFHTTVNIFYLKDMNIAWKLEA